MKQTLIAAGVIVLALSLGGVVVYQQKKNKEPLPPPCPADVMMCPDGPSVPRSGPDCSFGVCKQELPSYLQKEVATTTSSEQALPPTPPTEDLPKKTATTNLFKKISSTASNVFTQAVNSITGDVASGVKESIPSTKKEPTTTQPQNTTSTQPSPALNETRYLVIEGNKLIDHNNTVIYTLPNSSANSATGGSGETHYVNAVQVNQVAPVVGAIPVDGLPGKYYLSENFFSTTTQCQFSNKIYILDINTGTQSLMYEENNTTLSYEDPRACSHEIFLLATEGEKLILKYHTLGTNMVCESTWSEPEKTWYLDVTKPENGTKRYYITAARYTEAEEKESACRAVFDASSTPQEVSTTTISG